MVLGIGGVTLDRIAVVQRIPGWDEIDYISETTVQQGGMVATAMVAVSRLGMGAKFIGGIGDDEEGRLVIDSFIRERVEVTGIERFSGGRTAFSHVFVNEFSGKRAIVHFRGVQGKTRLSAADIDLTGVRAVHMDGFWHETALTVMKRARILGIPTTIDPSSRIDDEHTGEIFSLADYIIPSYHFARDHAGTDDPFEAAGFFLRYGCRAAVVTMGEDGSFLVTSKEKHHVPAYPVEVKDTTGAGDVFHGAFCVGIVKGFSLERSIRFAGAVAAIKCTKLGGQAGIPGIDEVYRFLESRGEPVE